MKITTNSFEWSAGDLYMAAKLVEKFSPEFSHFSPILSDFSPFSRNLRKFRHSSNSFAL